MNSKERHQLAQSEFDQQKYDEWISCGPSRSFVYVLLVTPGYESTYHKIGHTKDLTLRWIGENIPSYVCLLTSKDMTQKNAIQLEHMLHDAFIDKRYKPIARFNGYTECFKLGENDLSWIKSVFT